MEHDKTTKVLAGAFLASALLGTCFAVPMTARASAEDTLKPDKNTAVLTQTDAYGRDVEIEVEKTEDGEYLLADYTRNIFALDARNDNAPIVSENGQFSDVVAVSVFYNTVTAYNYFAENFGIYGINGGNDDIAGNWDERSQEIPIYLYIHDNSAIAVQNAFFAYNPQRKIGTINVGDGNMFSGKLYQQGKALDIIAHEYTHGIIWFYNASNAQLEYEGDSGALNEAFADIFGSLIEDKDIFSEDFWIIGEDAMLTGYLRSTKSPSGTQRTYVSEKFVCSRSGDHSKHPCDNNGVHYNSTIISHVAYEVWEKLPSYFTKERIGQHWFRTLNKLTRDATFDDFTAAFREAARELDFSDEALDVIDRSLFESGLYADEELHRVQYRNYDETVLKTMILRGDESAEPPEDPSREPTVRYRFEFEGWTEAVDKETGDVIYTAQYNAFLRTYTVTFTDSEGYPIKTETVEYGSAATPPEEPEKASTKELDFDFDHWQGDYLKVMGDTVVTPVYREIVCHYVRFLNDNGEEFARVRVRDGENALSPAIPTKESTLQIDYHFDYWEGDLENVTEDRTAVAVFAETLIEYTVIYILNGEEYGREILHYKDYLSPPVVSAGNFEGWFLDEAFTQSANGATVSGDMVVYGNLGTEVQSKEGGYKPQIFISAGVVVILLGSIAVAVLILKKKKS